MGFASVDKMLATMTPDEFEERYAASIADPPDEIKAAAMVCCFVGNLFHMGMSAFGGNSDAKPPFTEAEFLPQLISPEDDEDELEKATAAARAYAQQFG